MSKGMTVLRARRSVGALVVVLTAAAALGVTAAPAGAWPYPFTPDQVAYLNTVRGNFPGDDDQLVTAGLQACRLLYTGQSRSKRSMPRQPSTVRHPIRRVLSCRPHAAPCAHRLRADVATRGS